MNNNYLIMCFPFAYFSKTRVNSVSKKVAWVFTYFIPLFLLSFFYDIYSSLNSVVVLVSSIFIINYAYEDGYIYNDFITSKKEKKPTIRLPVDRILEISNLFLTFIIIRVAITLIFFFFLYLSSDIYDFILFIFIYIILQLTYFVYNNNRGIINLYLIIPLSFIRFYGPLMIFIPDHTMFLSIICLSFLYPISKFIEFSARKRFNISFFNNKNLDINKFRVFYYMIIALTFAILTIFSIYYLPFLIVSAYYFIYRGLGVLAIKLNKNLARTFKNNHRNHIN